MSVWSAGCATKLPIGDFCDTAKPLIMKRTTVLYIDKNDRTFADGVLGHNEYGEKTCKWKP